MAASKPAPAQETTAPVAGPTTPSGAPAGPGPGVYECVDPQERTDLWPGFPPQTSVAGDVCALPVAPADGRWVATDKAVNRLPDNHPDAPAMAESRRLAAAAGQASAGTEAATGGELS